MNEENPDDDQNESECRVNRSALPEIRDQATVFDVTTRVVIREDADHDPGVHLRVEPAPDESRDPAPTIFVDLTTAFQPDISIDDIAATAIAYWIDTFLQIVTDRRSDSVVDALWTNVRARPVLLGTFVGLAKWDLRHAKPAIAYSRKRDYRRFCSALRYFTLDSPAVRQSTHHTERILETRDHVSSGLEPS